MVTLHWGRYSSRCMTARVDNEVGELLFLDTATRSFFCMEMSPVPPGKCPHIVSAKNFVIRVNARSEIVADDAGAQVCDGIGGAGIDASAAGTGDFGYFLHRPLNISSKNCQKGSRIL